MEETKKKCVAVITCLSVILIMIGLVVGGIGVLLEVGSGVFNFTSLTVWLTTRLQSAGFEDIDLSTFDFMQLLETLSLPLIAIGMYSTFVGLCGMIAAKTGVIALLILYSLFLGLGLLLQGVAICIVFGQRHLFDGTVKTSLLEGLHNNYKGYNETNLTSQMWNIVMVTLRCCGVDGYQDFGKCTEWRRKLFQDGWWFDLRTPLTCCNTDLVQPGDFACAVNPTTYTSYFEKGCYDTFWGLFDSYRGYPLIVMVLLMILQLIPIISSLILARIFRKRAKKDRITAEDDSNEPTEDSNGIPTVDQNNEHRQEQKKGQVGGGHSLAEGLFASLPMSGLNNFTHADPLQQYLNATNRNAFNADLFSQFFMGSYRNNRMPSFDYGSQPGPIIVQLPQTQQAPLIPPAPRLNLMAITESQEEVEDDEPDVDETPTKQVKKESKATPPKFERCKSESCMSTKQKCPNKSDITRGRTSSLACGKTHSTADDKRLAKLCPAVCTCHE